MIRIFARQFRCWCVLSVRRLEKAVAASGVVTEVLGKFGKMCPESRDALNQRISDTGKGKPAPNLGLKLPRTLSPPLVRLFVKDTMRSFRVVRGSSGRNPGGSNLSHGEVTEITLKPLLPCWRLLDKPYDPPSEPCQSGSWHCQLNRDNSCRQRWLEEQHLPTSLSFP